MQKKFNIDLPRENKLVYTDKNKINEDRVKILEEKANNIEIEIEEIKERIMTLDKKKNVTHDE